MKKILLLLCTLLGTVGAWATQYTITYGTTTGTFYNGSGSAVTSGWIAKWVSNEEGKPKVTLTASANNINAENGRMAPGSSETSTYTLYVEGGYKVTGFSMNCPTFGAEVTVTPTGESAIVVPTGETLVVNSSAASFVYSGSNSGRIQAGSNDSGSFTITVEEDPEAQSWLPSFGIGSTIVVTGDKAESVTAATNGADNDHWYLITQVRNSESALYDNGTQLMRGTTDKTAVSFNGATVESSSAYLVRFISAGSEDLYHIQLGNGRYIVNLDANPSNGTAVNTTSDYWSKGTHAFYNSNGGSGSYFGWNLNEKSAKKVDNNGAGNALSYWGEGTASGTSGNSIWYVYPVTINTPASTVDVTYNLEDGGNIVNTTTVTVGANTEINIPSELTTGYSNTYYDFNTTGTIGDEDCIITVTPALKDATVVYPYTAISNNKSYYIYTNNKARGGLSTYTDNGITYLAASVKSALSISPKKFAIINYEDNYYLYSVEDAKFVTFDGSEATKATLASTVTGTGDRITFSQTNAPLYEIKFDGSTSKIFNASNSQSYPYGIVFNSWGSSSGQWDDGCQYTINEADDFDPTDAIAALEYSFAIAQLETYPYGTGLNQYSLIMEALDYTSQATDIISGLKTQGYSAENLAVAQGLIAGTSLNMPTAGFYRIKGKTSGNYLAAGIANSKYAMSDATDATTIFYYDGTKVVNFSSGMANGMSQSSWNWVTGDAASTVVFADGGSNGGYTFKSANAFFYDGGTNADRGSSLNNDAKYRNWYLTEVTTLPVTISSAAGYATLYAPIALTIPEAEGVTAYVAADEGDYLTLTAIVGGVIPANTGVILKSDATTTTTYNFDITTGDNDVDGNVLTGNVAAISRPTGSYILATGSNGVGFYADGAGTIPGFKAYLPASTGGSVKTFRFALADGIGSLNSEQMNSVCYDLQGRRISKPARGLYIINGKKVLVK